MNPIFLGRSAFIIAIIAILFIISAVVLSFITSSTIIKPIQKLEDGANEIANGNLDCVIDYDSTNEIGLTVDSFNAMTMRLRDSIKQKSEIEESRREMIAGVAHDLRTPLTSVKGYVEGLMDGIADTPEKQERYLKTIYSSTLSMEKLLNELLTVSRLETGAISLDLSEVNINEFLEDCFVNTQLAMEQRGIEYILNNNCSPNTTVMLDSDQFQRVIKNILSNSVNYRREDVKSKIEISAQDYKKAVIISIADNGEGVSEDNIQKIFDSFYRDDPARTKVSEGSGIGLYVCKQIVEMHGGRIWATGKEGKGLTIHIALDLVRA
jgi:signal transduction histidine kinase